MEKLNLNNYKSGAITMHQYEELKDAIEIAQEEKMNLLETLGGRSKEVTQIMVYIRRMQSLLS